MYLYNTFFTDVLPIVQPKAASILLFIANYKNQNYGKSPSIQQIKDHTSIGRDSINNNIKILIVAGFLEKRQTTNNINGRFGKIEYKIKCAHISFNY